MSLNVNKKKTYALVEFLNGKKKECAVVPLIWLLDDRKRCYWPRTRSQEVFDKQVLDYEPYDATWMKYEVHRVLKVSDDYGGIMKYMDIILEHGSTEDDGLNSIEISQKKIVQPSDNREEENTSNSSDSSDSSDSSKRMITKTKYRSNQKNMRKGINRGESEFSHSSGSENEISKRRNLNFDDSQEHDLRSSEKNVNGNLKNKNASTSTLHTDRNKCQNRSESSSSKNTQNINMEFNGHASSRLELGAGTIMSQQQFQKYIIERLEKITVLSEQNNACTSRLLQTMMTFLNPTSKPDGLPELPLKNDDDFNKLEQLLSEKTVNAGGREIPAPAYDYLKGRLSTIGGVDQRASVMNMLKFVITNELAMTYNWKGQKKRSFEATKLREVITDAAKMQFKGNNSSDKCIKDAIQSWLKLAKSRHIYNANARKN